MKDFDFFIYWVFFTQDQEPVFWGLKLYSAIKIVPLLCASIRCFGNLAPVYSYYLVCPIAPGAQFQLIQFPKLQFWVLRLNESINASEIGIIFNLRWKYEFLSKTF